MKLFLIIILLVFAFFIFFVLKFASSFLRTLNKINYNIKNKKQTRHYGKMIYDKNNIKVYKGDANNKSENRER